MQITIYEDRFPIEVSSKHIRQIEGRGCFPLAHQRTGHADNGALLLTRNQTQPRGCDPVLFSHCGSGIPHRNQFRAHSNLCLLRNG